MDKELQYEDYSVQNFVEDKNFRRWVTEPNDSLQFFWNAFQKDFPGKKSDIVQARQIVMALSFTEAPVNPKEYQESLMILKEKILQRRIQKKSIVPFFRWWSKVAAILIIPLIFACFYFFLTGVPSNNNNSRVVKYIVPAGQKSNVILADGTHVWLNSGSTLSYPENNSQSVRKVHLEGEAYFEVTKDTQRPFLVETRDYTVKVHGTHFNVQAYTTSKESEVILAEGSVSVLTPDQREIIKMEPGQRFYSDRNKRCTISNVDPNLYLSWKDNVLSVDNEELQHLIIRMERWYGVKINVVDFERVKNIRYTMTIKTESLREMLSLMNFVTPLTYHINGDKITIKYNN